MTKSIHVESELDYSDADLEADLAKRRERREKDYDGTRRWRQEQAQKKADILKAAKDIISAGKKALALKAHPDHGGSDEGMQNINTASLWLLEQVANEQDA